MSSVCNKQVSVVPLMAKGKIVLQGTQLVFVSPYDPSQCYYMEYDFVARCYPQLRPLLPPQQSRQQSTDIQQSCQQSTDVLQPHQHQQSTQVQQSTPVNKLSVSSNTQGQKRIPKLANFKRPISCAQQLTQVNKSSVLSNTLTPTSSSNIDDKGSSSEETDDGEADEDVFNNFGSDVEEPKAKKRKTISFWNSILPKTIRLEGESLGTPLHVFLHFFCQEKYQTKQHDSKTTNKKLWSSIIQEMEKAGVVFPSSKSTIAEKIYCVDQKYRNLNKQYRKHKLLGTGGGDEKGREIKKNKPWYFDQLDAVLGTRQLHDPKFIINSQSFPPKFLMKDDGQCEIVPSHQEDDLSSPAGKATAEGKKMCATNICRPRTSVHEGVKNKITPRKVSSSDILQHVQSTSQRREDIESEKVALLKDLIKSGQDFQNNLLEILKKQQNQ